jgi:ribosomal protein S18 acetylase RimI-like enzyme
VTVQVRPATIADTEAILRLWAEVVEHASIDDRVEDVHRLITRDPEALLVAEDGGRIVGTVTVGWDGWRGNMYRLAVSPDARRKGIAGALVAEAERRLAVKGCRRVSALVIESEETAQAFWASAGYGHHPKVLRFVKNIE